MLYVGFMNTTGKVTSPCVRQCCLDEQDICLGCSRSLQEILDWAGLTEEGKAAVLVIAHERKCQRSSVNLRDL
jgi:predicted Fe-S protein YdhL (DUF1289 family)